MHFCARNVTFFFSAVNKFICEESIFIACLPFGKKLQVRQKAEAELEATNCVASDEESCRHVYKALEQLSARIHRRMFFNYHSPKTLYPLAARHYFYFYLLCHAAPRFYDLS